MKTNKMIKNPSMILLNILFYLCLGVLLFFLIAPHTSFWFRKDWAWGLGNRLNKEDVVLAVGDKFQLKVLAVNKRISFTSTDFKVADVDGNGWVTGIRKGETIIQVKYDNYMLKCRVRVIQLKEDTLTLSIKQKAKIKVEGWNGRITYKSSDKSVASVNRFGIVTGKKKGTTTITVKVKNVKLKCKINID